MAPQEWLDRVLRDNPDAEPRCIAEILWPIVSSPDFVCHWLRHALAKMSRHPADLPSGYADPVLQSVVLIDDGRVNLSLVMICATHWQVQAHRTGAIIDFADGWTRLRFLVASDAMIQRHHRITGDDSRRACADRPQRVEAGQDFAFDNASEALRFTHVGADVVLLRLVTRDPEASRAVECDAQSGAVLRIRQAQAQEGRVRMTISLLRSLEEHQALDVITQSLPTWPPHLRWHGVMEALALDSQFGFDLLERMVGDDPDPGLRRQAAQTHAALLVRYPDLRHAG